jgi:phage shock protein E
MSGNVWIAVAGVVLAMLVIRRLLGGKRVSAMVILEKIKTGAKVVDVRSSGEFQGGAYPGAVNIPVQELAQHLNELPRDRPIVVYCASGMRSASAERLLRAHGFAEVYNGGGLSQMPR